MLLNGSPFVFVIDLAALASRREYLKLDKWLRDKLKEHQVTSFLHNFVINTKVNLSNTIMVTTGQEMVREKIIILQGQKKVREFHFMSGKI